MTVTLHHFQLFRKQVDAIDQKSPSLTSDEENTLECIDLPPDPS